MTLNKLEALLAEARQTGRSIQMKSFIKDHWEDLSWDEEISFTMDDANYRVAPPKPESTKAREFWLASQFAVPVNCNTTHLGSTEGWIRVREILEESK